MLQTRAGSERARPSLCPIGCAGRITSYAETGDGRYLITLTGVSRFRILDELPAHSPYRRIRADFDSFEADLHPAPELPEYDRAALLDGLKAYLEGRGLDIDWDQVREAPLEALVNSLSMALPFEAAEKQALLEAASLPERRAALVALMHIGAASGDDDAPKPLMQ